MIRPIKEEHIAEVVAVIRESFLTVANEFGFTEENCPGFTAFATDEHRIRYQLLLEQRPAYGYFADDKLVGYFSLTKPENNECEISNLCVLPDYRHKGIGEELLRHALERAAKLGCVKMNIGYVAENTQLREWYESFGFVYFGAKKYEHFIFTCGYMEKSLSPTGEVAFYEGKRFVPKTNTENGEVDGNTVFEYHQQGDMVWADYSGGEVIKGHLLGTVDENGELDFYYQHLNIQGQIRVGVCHSIPKIRDDGKLEMEEKWQWLNGDRSAGESVIVEK